MKACNGYTREQFRRNSPGHRLQDLLATFSESKALVVDKYFPDMLLIHGIEDDTVPFTATAETARMIRSAGIQNCDEIYVPRTGHQDAVMHLMLGGRVKDLVGRWLQAHNVNRRILQSKL
jgi:Prolyl oligopeptidase family